MAQIALARSLYRALGGPKLVKRLRTSDPLANVIPFRGATWTRRYPGYGSSANQGYYRSRWDWNRHRLPLYGSVTSGIPVVLIDLPDNWNLIYTGAPSELPLAKWARPRLQYSRYGMPQPEWEFMASRPPPRPPGTGIPHESHRRRHDSKVPAAYNKALAIYNRTFGEYDEYVDFVHAFKYARSPLDIVNNLAVNQWIDQAYGYRAKALKRHIYSQNWYNLPVGLPTLSRLWNH